MLLKTFVVAAVLPVSRRRGKMYIIHKLDDRYPPEKVICSRFDVDAEYYYTICVVDIY